MAVTPATLPIAPASIRPVVDGIASRSETLMGGRATITIIGGPSTLLDASFELAHRCESLWSRFIPTSDIMRLNRSEGRATSVDALTASLVATMIDGHYLTAGTFDPTLLPDVIAAGYDRSVLDPSRNTVLPVTAVSPGRPLDVRIDGTEIRLPLGTTLDAGGIGKGATADAVCALAIAGGATGVMAEIGGDIVVAGEGPRASGWHVGIENPFVGDDRVGRGPHVDVIRLTSGAVATSSTRRRVFTVDGVVRHHLLDPATRRSADRGVQTVSVVAATGARAEVLTKAGFFIGRDEYLSWLPTVGAAGLMIDADGTCHASTNWEQHR